MGVGERNIAGCFLYVSWLEIEPATFAYPDNTLTNWARATQPGLWFPLLCPQYLTYCQILLPLPFQWLLDQFTHLSYNYHSSPSHRHLLLGLLHLLPTVHQYLFQFRPLFSLFFTLEAGQSSQTVNTITLPPCVNSFREFTLCWGTIAP